MRAAALRRCRIPRDWRKWRKGLCLCRRRHLRRLLVVLHRLSAGHRHRRVIRALRAKGAASRGEENRGRNRGRISSATLTATRVGSRRHRFRASHCCGTLVRKASAARPARDNLGLPRVSPSHAARRLAGRPRRRPMPHYGRCFLSTAAPAAPWARPRGDDSPALLDVAAKVFARAGYRLSCPKGSTTCAAASLSPRKASRTSPRRRRKSSRKPCRRMTAPFRWCSTPRPAPHACRLSQGRASVPVDLVAVPARRDRAQTVLEAPARDHRRPCHSARCARRGWLGADRRRQRLRGKGDRAAGRHLLRLRRRQGLFAAGAERPRACAI